MKLTAVKIGAVCVNDRLQLVDCKQTRICHVHVIDNFLVFTIYLSLEMDMLSRLLNSAPVTAIVAASTNAPAKEPVNSLMKPAAMGPST